MTRHEILESNAVDYLGLWIMGNLREDIVGANNSIGIHVLPLPIEQMQRCTFH